MYEWIGNNTSSFCSLPVDSDPSVSSVKVADNSLTGNDIANDSLTGSDIDESTMSGFVRTSGDSTISSGSLWFSNGSAQAKISDNGSAYFLNSVGVGTANPASSDGRSRVVDISGGGVGENLPGLVLRSSVSGHTNKAWEILLGSESGSASSFHIENNTAERMRIDSGGGVRFPALGIKDGDDAAAWIDLSTGELKRNSSSLRYKEDIQDINVKIATEKLYELRPVSFSYKHVTDEEVAASPNDIKYDVGDLPPVTSTV